MTATLGIDPGGRYVGLALLDGTDLVRARVLDRRRLGIPDGDRPAWVRTVIDAILDLALEADDPPAIAVEDVRPPNPHARRRDGSSLTNVTGILDTAVVVGAILALYPAVLVPPGGNGRELDLAYPATIRKGTRGLGGPPDHARAAYDVARAAAWHRRLEAAR